MAGSTIILRYLLLLITSYSPSLATDLLFNGFQEGHNMNLTGSASITSNGILQLTNETERQVGHAFFSHPVPMLDSHSARPAAMSFSTAFVFDIVNTAPGGGGFGLAFVVSSSKNLSEAQPGPLLGIFSDNHNNNRSSSNRVFAVEFSTVQNPRWQAIDENHVDVNVNSMIPTASKNASYYRNTHKNVQMKLESGQPIQAWIDYDAAKKMLDVTISPLSVLKPQWPLISLPRDLSPDLKQLMYVGFSAATAKLSSNHYVLGWSFRTNGVARPLDLSLLPLPPTAKRVSSRASILKIGAAFTISTLALVAIVASTCWYLWQRAKLGENIEEWERNYPHRFPYKDLYRATKGFKETELLGVGGFGKVYKGILPHTREVIAVKKIRNNSTQGVKEFVAEVASLGRMRHRHLVQLKGWCKRNEELILVYEHMPNGSLDMFIFNNENTRQLSWGHRFKILKGIASGLLYLHEEWEQVVVHRDVKSSNVLLDADMNGRLGDFGLARLHGHENIPHTTRVVGTLGYMAPELSRTGRATASSDVFAYGMLLLEVACGRRPLEPTASTRELILMDWVRECKIKGNILEVVDPRLDGYYDEEEMELVLNLGLVCSQSIPELRPTMRQVTAYLNGDDSLKDDMCLSLVFSEVDPFDLASRISYNSSSGLMSTSSLQVGE